jgi:adsorption protein B
MLEIAIAIRDELLMLAMVGLALGGLDDLAVDILWIGRWLKRKVMGKTKAAARSIHRLPPARHSGRMAIFIPAWDEAAIIGDTIRYALARWKDDMFTLFIGCYRNDPDTLAVVRQLPDPRVRLAICPLPGPTTKADCLNSIFAAMEEEERRTSESFKAIVLHDAEDLVHPDELNLHDRLIEHFALVQIPVLPLQTKGSIWVSGHYVDEFAQAHCRDIVVRSAMGAALPLAGVGCAISRAAIAALSNRTSGRPFDDQSLTEDYELGLRLHEMGFPAVFARIIDQEGNGMIATRAHFPDTLDAAVRQKTRWTIGIALAGWDRLGWRRTWADNWMLLRDRRAPLAALVILAGYVALILSGVFALAGQSAHPPQSPNWWLLGFTSLCMAWRIVIRMICVWRHYGWKMSLIAAPRILVANLIFILAVRRAIAGYVRIVRTGQIRWDKTSHRSPLSA